MFVTGDGHGIVPHQAIHDGTRRRIRQACLLSVNTAFALQGPSGGPSTATPFAQFAMAVLVYGILALVVGTGLIGAMRRR